MSPNLEFFLPVVLAGLLAFQFPVLLEEASLIGLKAVGGKDDYGNYEGAGESTTNSESFSNCEENSQECSEESDNSELTQSSKSLTHISPRKQYSDNYLGNGVYSFNSFNQVVKYLMHESKLRKIPASFIDCKIVVNSYFVSKFTPNTGEDGEFIVSSREILELLTKYIRTNGEYIRKFTVKSPIKTDQRSSEGAYDNQGYESDTESSSDSDSETSQRKEAPRKGPHAPPEGTQRPESSAAREGLAGLMDKLAPVRSPLDGIFGKKDAQYSFKLGVSSERPAEAGPSLEENAEEAPGLKPVEEAPGLKPAEEAGSDSASEPPMTGAEQIREPGVEHDLGGGVLEEGVSRDVIIPCFDLRTRSYISFESKELEFELKTPWRSFISMFMYEPVRRSTLSYNEEHCKKVTKTAGRIIAYLIHTSCKLSQALKDYSRKKCNQKNKLSRFFVGCYNLKKDITKRINIYSKLRYDLFDTVVGITQCSLAKNNFSQSETILTDDQEGSNMIQCTLREYYLSKDFYTFLLFITDAYESAIEKLRQIISRAGGVSICPKGCRNKSHVQTCLEENLENLLADKTGVGIYSSRLGLRNLMCKVSLVKSHSFSRNIPESAEYVSSSGIKYRVEAIPYIQLVQFPVLHPSNMERLSIVKSDLLDILFNSISPEDLLSPSHKPPVSEKSATTNKAPGQAPASHSKLKQKKPRSKTTRKVTATSHPPPTTAQIEHWV